MPTRCDRDGRLKFDRASPRVLRITLTSPLRLRALPMLPATWDREAAGIAVKSKHAQHGKG